jgi:heat shock protein 90kDa beta
LDKIRYLSVTDKSQLGEGEASKLQIWIRADPEKKLLHIRDTGIGMTKEDLQNNLGRIAKSGTKEWIERLNKSDNLGQIGQFGVGFYSSFLVADKVTVTSKHNSDKQYIWESSSDSQTSYTITEDPRGSTLGRGTMVTLHLKEEAEEFLSEDSLKKLITKYSEFINFPIYLHTKKTVSKEVPVEEEAPATEDKPAEDKPQEAEIKEDDEEETTEEKKPKTKTVTETKYEWELINETKPIWTRSPKEITKEEYDAFFKSLAKDSSASSGPLTHIHFTAEGDVDFTALLYIPKEAPFGMFENRIAQNRVKLYVRRVFITDKFDDLIPKYLAFIVGVVDSDELPLNVSREMLQQHKTLKVIQKKLVRKAIAMIQDLEKDAAKYKEFYETYGTNLKLGAIEDMSNRSRLVKLLRFHSNKHRDEPVSLEQYVKEMRAKQDQIYYLGGESREALAHSPYLEKLAKKGYDVLFLTEPIDEYVVQTVQKFDNKYKFVDVSKEGLKLDEDEEKELKELNEEFKPLTDFLKDEVAAGSKYVEKVQLSTRLMQTPCALISSTHGYSANMERIMRAQALSDKRYKQYMTNQAKKTLEINPSHPIIKEMLRLVKEEQKEKARESAEVLLETALISTGYAVEDPTVFAARVHRVLGNSLDIDPAVFQSFDEEISEKAKTVAEEPAKEEEKPEEEADSKSVSDDNKDEL